MRRFATLGQHSLSRSCITGLKRVREISPTSSQQGYCTYMRYHNGSFLMHAQPALRFLDKVVYAWFLCGSRPLSTYTRLCMR